MTLDHTSIIVCLVLITCCTIIFTSYLAYLVPIGSIILYLRTYYYTLLVDRCILEIVKITLNYIFFSSLQLVKHAHNAIDGPSLPNIPNGPLEMGLEPRFGWILRLVQFQRL